MQHNSRDVFRVSFAVRRHFRAENQPAIIRHFVSTPILYHHILNIAVEVKDFAWLWKTVFTSQLFIGWNVSM